MKIDHDMITVAFAGFFLVEISSSVLTSPSRYFSEQVSSPPSPVPELVGTNTKVDLGAIPMFAPIAQAATAVPCCVFVEGSGPHSGAASRTSKSLLENSCVVGT